MSYNLHPKPGSNSTMVHITFVAGGVEFAVHVYVDRNVKNIRIVVECSLATVACSRSQQLHDPRS